MCRSDMPTLITSRRVELCVAGFILRKFKTYHCNSYKETQNKGKQHNISITCIFSFNKHVLHFYALGLELRLSKLTIIHNFIYIKVEDRGVPC